MKKKVIRIMAGVTAAVMLLAVAAGCKKSPDSLYEPPEFVFVAESIPLPEDVENISNLIYMDGRLYFMSRVQIEGNEENSYSFSYYPELYSMSIDGTDLTKLEGYKLPADVAEDASGGTQISMMSADDDGSLWVIENWNYGGYDLPDDFDGENDEVQNYEYIEHSSGNGIRKLDKTGAELISIDVSRLAGQQGYFYPQSFDVDSSGNLYLNVYDFDTAGPIIYVLDSNGNLLFELTGSMYFDRFVRTTDGSMAFPSDSIDKDGNFTRALQKIDVAAKGLGDTVNLPTNTGQTIMPGSGEYDFLISENNNLYGYTEGEEEAVKLLNWLESDVSDGDIQNLTMLSEDCIICTSQTYDNTTYEQHFELLILTKTPYSELPERTVLTLATFYSYSVRDAVVKFNRTNPDYRVQIIDYSEFNTDDDYSAGLKKLSTELISGKVPDMLDVANLPYDEYVAKGLLADLYPFIDEDPDFDRSDFVDGLLRASEVNGGLYQVFPSFYINTILGHPSVLGPEPGWNMEEFKAVLDAHPEADMPLGQWLTKLSFLQPAVSFHINEYIDWEKGTVNFDSPGFIQLLEFCNTFPSEIDWGNYMYQTDAQAEAIAAGRQIMIQQGVYDFMTYIQTKAMFGGEFVCKGFPTESRNGNSLSAMIGLSIVDKSPYRDEAWTFVRTVLDKDWQLSNSWGILSNKAAFDVRVEEAMKLQYGFDFRGGGITVYSSDAEDENDSYMEEQGYVMYRFTQEDGNQIKSLINSASGTSGWNIDQSIWEIISEGASDYFNGTSSAPDAARVIQNRVSILVSERS